MKSTRKKTDPPAAADGGNPTVETAAGVDEVEQLAPSAVEEPESPTAEEEEEEADDDDDGEEEEAEVETLKLEEGFYEIEDIRKKRIRKSQLQYLIKWRGWPESANTWEPADNLDACADIVDAFEERLRTPRSSRKRRRRQSAGPHTTAAAKKKRPAGGTNTTDSKEDATDCEAGEQDENEEENKKELLADEQKPPTEPAEANGSPADHTKDPPQGSAAAAVAAAAAAAASTDEKNGLPLAAGFITIDLTGAEDPCMEGTSKAQSEVSSHFRGAKKRKSGSVRRFKQDPPPNSQDVDQSTAVKHENGSADRPNEDVDSTEDETDDKTATPDADYAGDPKPSITKIIMPVRYFASVTNNVQEVAITFKALRSDGKEVLVDDKHLKANNPLLLIGYYEQHLRYNPHA